jgi:hypothetical protein
VEAVPSKPGPSNPGQSSSRPPSPVPSNLVVALVAAELGPDARYHPGSTTVTTGTGAVVDLAPAFARLLCVPPAQRPATLAALLRSVADTATDVAQLQLQRWECVAHRIGLRLVAQAASGAEANRDQAAPGPGRRALTRRLGAGVALQVIVDLGPSVLEPPGWLCHQWGQPTGRIMARAVANTLASPVTRLDHPTPVPLAGPKAQLTLLSGGAFTTGRVVDLGRLIPNSLVGRGLMATTSSNTLAVLTSRSEWANRDLRQAARWLNTVVVGAGDTLTSLILFHRAGEFAIFGSNGTRRDDLLA